MADSFRPPANPAPLIILVPQLAYLNIAKLSQWPLYNRIPQSSQKHYTRIIFK